jgi:hypothetical protein
MSEAVGKEKPVDVSLDHTNIDVLLLIESPSARLGRRYVTKLFPAAAACRGTFSLSLHRLTHTTHRKNIYRENQLEL